MHININVNDYMNAMQEDNLSLQTMLNMSEKERQVRNGSDFECSLLRDTWLFLSSASRHLVRVRMSLTMLVSE